ncbi:MAG TPA: VWA domain-containing protein [Pirellulales bacterium]|nr:VWA domain-containing protein [Pirellulales bacterium]
MFAQAAPADAVSAVAKAARYQFAQVQSFSEWWQMPLLIVICAALLAYVIYMYRRDSVELRPAIGILLAALRIAAFAGLLLVYLDLQKWSEQQEIQNSRVLVGVDGSISMALNDVDGGSSSATGSASASAPTTRIGQVVEEFAHGHLLDDLRQRHDVTVFRFDQHLSRVAMLPKRADTTLAVQTDEAADAARQQRIEWLRLAAYAGVVLLVLSAIGYGIGRFIAGRRIGWAAAVLATIAVAISFSSAAALSLGNPDDDLLALLDWRQVPPSGATADSSSPDSGKSPAAKQAKEHKIDWATALKANGIETRIGDALRQLVSDHRSQPISGIVLITDGGQNAGLDPSAAVEVAQEAGMPVYTIGLGSDHRPTSVDIADFAVPVRVYPGDSFAVTADLLAHGLNGRIAQVELASRPAGKGAAAKSWTIEGQQQVTLPADGKKERVKFELAGVKDTGRRTLELRIKSPVDPSGTGARPKNQTQDADVEIVDRKNRVLLIAGGPTREYRFLRTQLHRDRDTVVDVLLQTAQPGISQEANKILDRFPDSMQELSQYDTIVAFDPNWEKLGGDTGDDAADIAANDQAIDLLERWVAEEAGGLVLIAGPVYTDDWVNDQKLGKLRALYPVEFSRLLAGIRDAKFGSEKPGAIEFTREGQQAEFLWLSEPGREKDVSAAMSDHIWTSFKGVFGYYRVRGKKPGATVYARYADPELAGGNEELPIYMAGQLYGAGRVFYEGSGEMWRLRAMDESYFEQFYTKLLRYVSQGRMLRGSRRGYLSVDRDSYLLGSVVDVEARLTDAQHNPLNKPKVVAEVTPQDGAPLMLPLLQDPGRKGMFRGEFIAVQPGPVRIELPIPDSDEDPLSRQIMVKVPDLEKDNPQRNDALLSEIAARTKGRYYIGIPAALGAPGPNSLPPLAAQLKDQTRTTVRSGDRDKPWERLWGTWLLCGICGALCLEWLIRRLSRLA